MIVAALICIVLESEMRSRRTISASALSIVVLFSDANAVTRISAPSSSRMLRSMLLAMSSSTSPGTSSRSICAFLRRMAMRVSSSGG